MVFALQLELIHLRADPARMTRCLGASVTITWSNGSSRQRKDKEKSQCWTTVIISGFPSSCRKESASWSSWRSLTPNFNTSSTFFETLQMGGRNSSFLLVICRRHCGKASIEKSTFVPIRQIDFLLIIKFKLYPLPSFFSQFHMCKLSFKIFTHFFLFWC